MLANEDVKRRQSNLYCWLSHERNRFVQKVNYKAEHWDTCSVCMLRILLTVALSPWIELEVEPGEIYRRGSVRA